MKELGKEQEWVSWRKDYCVRLAMSNAWRKLDYRNKSLPGTQLMEKGKEVAKKKLVRYHQQGP